jgi:hypothetical protein
MQIDLLEKQVSLAQSQYDTANQVYQQYKANTQ